MRCASSARESRGESLNAAVVRLPARLSDRDDSRVNVVLVGFMGTGDLWLRVVEQATDQVVFQSPRRTARFPQDPQEVLGLRFRINQCPLPQYGRYRLELLVSDEVIAARPFWLLPRA